jgi:hypothetical protein
VGAIFSGIVMVRPGIQNFYVKWCEILENTIYIPEIIEKWTMASILESAQLIKHTRTKAIYLGSF